MGTLSRKLTVVSVWLLFLGLVTENVKSDKMKSIDKNIDECKAEARIKVDLLARKELMEKARRKLPYTFEGKTL
jgi:hypothetical protein